MMTQETYVNINDLHKQGWTIQEIADETGWHRTTVSQRLKEVRGTLLVVQSLCGLGLVGRGPV